MSCEQEINILQQFSWVLGYVGTWSKYFNKLSTSLNI